MKRWIRRTLAVGLGLILGWWVAGFVSELTPVSAADSAATHGPVDSNHAADADHAKKHDTADHEKDAGQAAAELLTPQPGDIGWLQPVLLGTGGLFLAALLVGIPVVRYRAAHPEPAPAHDAHAAHADAKH